MQPTKAVKTVAVKPVQEGGSMELQRYNFNGNGIRIIQHEGQPWFVLKDLCDALGHQSPNVIARRLDADQRLTIDAPDGRGNRHKIIVTESGMWDVLMRSDSKRARPFQRWLTDEVLPAIRRTGSYTPAPEAAALPAPASPDLVAVLQQLGSTVLQPLAQQMAQAVQAVEAKVEAAKAEVREEMTTMVHQMDAKIGSLTITSEQNFEVKKRINAIVARRTELKLSRARHQHVYADCWAATGVGNISLMTRAQWPGVIEYLDAELAALRVMNPNRSLFREANAAPA